MKRILLTVGLVVCVAYVGLGFVPRPFSAIPRLLSSVTSHPTSSSPHDGTLDEAIQELRKMKIEREFLPEPVPGAFREIEESVRKMEEEKEKAAKEGRQTQFSDSVIQENKRRIVVRRERSGERGKALVESMLQSDLKRYREEFEKLQDIKHTQMNPEEMEKAWVQDLWYHVDYLKRVREYPDRDENSLIEIRGCVLDQEGSPVANANLTFEISFSKRSVLSMAQRRKEIAVTTDGKGVYRIENERGHQCDLIKIVAPGYRFLPKHQKSRSFTAQRRISEEEKMQWILRGEKTYQGNYVEFCLWKELGNPEKVVLRGDICGERGSMEGLGHRGILKVDEHAYAYDLFKDRFDWQAIKSARLDKRKESEIKKAGMDKPFYETELSTTGNAQPDPKEYAGKGDFVSQIFQSPDNPHQAILRITAIDGGVVANSTKCFVAPEEGYQSSLEFPLNLKENTVFADFFLKSRGGQVYSRLTAGFDSTNVGSRDNPDYNLRGGFGGIISPTGSRVLEPWGGKYTQGEATAFSRQDWKEAGK